MLPPCFPQMSASFTQDGGSHVSYEDKLTTTVIPAMLMAFTAAAAVVAKLAMQRRKEGGRVHPTLQFMLSAFAMHWVFLAVHTLHLRAFAGRRLLPHPPVGNFLVDFSTRSFYEFFLLRIPGEKSWGVFLEIFLVFSVTAYALFFSLVGFSRLSSR